MPLVPRGAMSVSYGFRDQEQTESTMLVHLENPLGAIIDFTGFVQLITFGRVALANAVTQLSESDLSMISVKLSERETDQDEFGTGEAEKKGVFLFNDITGMPSFRMAIPGIKEECLAENGRDIDLSNADVAAFVDEFAVVGTGRPITANGVSIGAPFAAYKQHRISLRGRARRTG